MATIPDASTRPLIVFDAMGVVYLDPDDVAACLVPFLEERRAGASAQEVKAAYRRASLGASSPLEFWEALGLGGLYPAVQDEYLSSRLRLDPGFPAAARELSRGFDLAMLSNDIGEWSATLRRFFGIAELFAFTVISSDARARKPEPEIYRFLLGRAGRPPGLCLMIDDRLANLEPARALGMRTALFRRDAAAAREWPVADSAFAPDLVLDSMDGLPTAVGKLFAEE